MQKANFFSSASRQLKEHVKGLRAEINGLGSLETFSEWLIGREDEYDCPEGMTRIRNTWYCNIADFKITQHLQNYRNQLLSA